MSEPSSNLSNLRNEALGVTLRARLEWTLQRHRIAVGAGDHDSAYRTLRGFAEEADFRSLSPSARRTLVLNLVELAARAGIDAIDADLTGLAFESNTVSRASRTTGLRLLELERPIHAMKLARVLQRGCPSDGFGSYLLAFSYELAIRSETTIDEAFNLLDTPVVALYRNACKGFEAFGDADMSATATLGAIRHAFSMGAPDAWSRNKARELTESLTGSSKLELVVILASGSMFTDRLRALDQLEDLWEIHERARPGEQIRTKSLVDATLHAIDHLPDELRELERDRWLEAISQLPLECAATARARFDAVRRPALPRLEDLENTDVERTTKAIKECAFSGLDASYLDAWLALETLEPEARKAWTPAVAAWAARAPRPSFGFRALAAHLHTLKMPDAARAVDHRAMIDDEASDPELERFVAARECARALKGAPDLTLLASLNRLARIDKAQP